MPRRVLLAVYEYLVLFFGLGFLAYLCLLWSVFAVLLHRVLPGRWVRPLGRAAIMAGFRCYLASLELTRGFRFDLQALDSLRDQGPLIIAPNHPSLLDAVMILSRLPNVACILKAALLDNILFGAGSRLAHYIRNDSPRGMIREAVEDLRRGSQLLLFPEGTRTTRIPVNAFKGGIGLIAARAGVPIQTVFIETNSAFLGKTWPWFRRAALPVHYRVRLGRRFDPPGNARLFTAELEHYYVAELSPLPAAARPAQSTCMAF